MKNKKECPTMKIMKVLGEKWMLLILRELYNEKSLRFGEIVKRMENISSRTLSKRLTELTKIQIVKRETFRETPPRVEYSLTNSGRELIKYFKNLDKWAIKWGI